MNNRWGQISKYFKNGILKLKKLTELNIDVYLKQKERESKREVGF